MLLTAYRFDISALRVKLLPIKVQLFDKLFDTVESNQQIFTRKPQQLGF